jgi:uncharacterized membrane-anchored protein
MNTTISDYDLSGELREVRRQKAARQIGQSVKPVSDYAHRAAKFLRKGVEAERALRLLLQINIELALVDAKRVAGYILIWFASLAVYFIDFILLGAVAEYFARRIYTDPIMVMLARVVIPVAILVIEMMISTQRSYNNDEALEYDRPRSQWVWLLFTLLIICVLPSMIVATHFATLPARLTPMLAMISRFQLIGLVAISIVMHGVILYGGKLAAESKAYLCLKWKTWRLRRKVRRAHDEFDNVATFATNGYIHHVQLVREYNSQFIDAQLRPGPFDKLTRELLRERIGDTDGELLPLMPDADATAPQQGSRPVAEIPGRRPATQF